MRAFQADALIMRAIQTGASNASDVQVQVMCKCELVALGGGSASAWGAVTTIGSTSLLKNEQKAKVLDGGGKGGNTGHD